MTQEFKRGEWVEVRDGLIGWTKRVFIIEIKGSMHPFLCVHDGDEIDFNNREPYRHTSWSECRKIPQPKKKVKMAQAVVNYRNGEQVTLSNFYYTSLEEAKEDLKDLRYPTVQWPLTINGVEQWVEIEIDEEESK